jgi:hypothetical protein
LLASSARLLTDLQCDVMTMSWFTVAKSSYR